MEEPITSGLSTKPDDILSRSLELLAATEPLEHCLLHGYSTLLFVGSAFGVSSKEAVPKFLGF